MKKTTDKDMPFPQSLILKALRAVIKGDIYLTEEELTEAEFAFTALVDRLSESSTLLDLALNGSVEDRAYILDQLIDREAHSTLHRLRGMIAHRRDMNERILSTLS